MSTHPHLKARVSGKDYLLAFLKYKTYTFLLQNKRLMAELSMECLPPHRPSKRFAMMNLERHFRKIKTPLALREQGCKVGDRGSVSKEGKTGEAMDGRGAQELSRGNITVWIERKISALPYSKERAGRGREKGGTVGAHICSRTPCSAVGSSSAGLQSL